MSDDSKFEFRTQAYDKCPKCGGFVDTRGGPQSGRLCIKCAADEIARLRAEKAELVEANERLQRDSEVVRELMTALKRLPVLPSPRLLKRLGSVAEFPSDWEAGKRLQYEHGLEAIPPKTECELGAGLWDRIRAALRAARAQSDPHDSEGETGCPSTS